MTHLHYIGGNDSHKRLGGLRNNFTYCTIYCKRRKKTKGLIARLFTMEENDKKPHFAQLFTIHMSDTDLSGQGTLRNMFHQRVTTIAT